MGLEKSTYDWFCSYLVCRKQFVSIDGSGGPERCVSCGVPQGSILAPTLFLIYINSMSQLKLTGILRLYADDSLLVYFGDSFETIKNLIINDLHQITKWLDSHKLSLNIKKSSYIFLSNRVPEAQEPISIGQNKKLHYSKQIKYLGLWIDETLSWDHHIDYLRNKIRGPIGILRKLNKLIPKRLLRSLFFSLIQSQLQYLTAAWFPTKKKVINPLIILHKRAIKNMYGLPNTFPTEQLYKKFNITSLSNIYNIQICKFFHQIINSNRHSSIVINSRNNIHSHSTRFCNNLETLLPQNNTGLNSLLFKGISVYNKLPDHLKNLSYQNFKMKIRKYFQ